MKNIGKVLISMVACFWVLTLLLVLVLSYYQKVDDANRFITLLINKEIELPLNSMANPNAEKVKDVRGFHTGTVVASKNFEDFVVSGFYQPLESGEYELSFIIVPACSNQKIADIDVTSNKGKTGHGTWEVIAKEEGKPQQETHVFRGAQDRDYEFRVFSFGECAFEIVSGKLKIISLDNQQIWDYLKDLYENRN